MQQGGSLLDPGIVDASSASPRAEKRASSDEEFTGTPRALSALA